MRHARPPFRVAPGSQQHALLCLLAPDDMTIGAMMLALRVTDTSVPDFASQVLGPLFEHGLVERVHGRHYMCSDAGSTLARQLGPVGAASPEPGAAEPTATNGQHAPLRHRSSMGTGDQRPPVRRPGSADARNLPSRLGDHLHWPCGRITEVQP